MSVIHMGQVQRASKKAGFRRQDEAAVSTHALLTPKSEPVKSEAPKSEVKEDEAPKSTVTQQTGDALGLAQGSSGPAQPVVKTLPRKPVTGGKEKE